MKKGVLILCGVIIFGVCTVAVVYFNKPNLVSSLPNKTLGQLSSSTVINKNGGATINQSPVTSIASLSVQGNHLVADGKVFSVKGVQMVGKLVPGETIDIVNPTYKAAYEHYGESQLIAAQGFGANTIRFQISQVGMDPQSSKKINHAAYLKEVQDAVNLALEHGFVVILSMQHQGGSGSGYDQALPGENTVRAWNVLAPVWKNDTRVLYEIYNEPALSADVKDGTIRTDNWKLWKEGGSWVANIVEKNKNEDNPTGIVIGMQSLIETIRATGAKNIIIVPGLSTEKSFHGGSLLSDPLNNLAYGVHSPYLNEGQDSWTVDFGYMTNTVPVIITEWTASNQSPNCEPNYPKEAPELLAYAVAHNMGVVGFSFDIPGTIIKDWNYTPTTFGSTFACSAKDAATIAPGGQGDLLHTYYTTGEIKK